MEATTTEIELERGKTGLGFNIRGGTDIPHLPEDQGIFISKIHNEGAAAKDGRLKEGDKILQVNGCTMTGVTHNEAVSYFRSSGTVKLLVEPGAERRILDARRKEEEPENPPPSPEPAGIPLGAVVAGGVVAVAAVYLAYRYYKSKS